MQKHRVIKLLFFAVLLQQTCALGIGWQGSAGYMQVGSNPRQRSFAVDTGIQMGLLTPYLLDFITGVSQGVINERHAFLCDFTLHYTHMFTKEWDMYLGIGFGLDYIFGKQCSVHKRDPYEAQFTGLITKAIIPVGIKYFKAIAYEFFVEACFDLGNYESWTKFYNTPMPHRDHISGEHYKHNFYWAVRGRLGFRYWF